VPSVQTAKFLPAGLNLQAVQGDDWNILLLLGPQTYTSYAEFLALANGYDVSSWSLASQLRRTVKDATETLSFSFGLSRASLGEVRLLAAADLTDPIAPGSYVWDLEAIIAGNERTLLGGTFLVKAKVTH